MRAQRPAEGISLQRDWGHAKTYNVECDCADPDHIHIVDISSEENLGVTVEIWTTAQTPFWKKSRWKMIWQLLTKGTVEYNVALIMREQAALNYADALKKAVKDVKNYKRV